MLRSIGVILVRNGGEGGAETGQHRCRREKVLHPSLPCVVRERAPQNLSARYFREMTSRFAVPGRALSFLGRLRHRAQYSSPAVRRVERLEHGVRLVAVALDLAVLELDARAFPPLGDDLPPPPVGQ